MEDLQVTRSQEVVAGSGNLEKIEHSVNKKFYITKRISDGKVDTLYVPRGLFSGGQLSRDEATGLYQGQLVFLPEQQDAGNMGGTHLISSVFRFYGYRVGANGSNYWFKKDLGSGETSRADVWSDDRLFRFDFLPEPVLRSLGATDPQLLGVDPSLAEAVPATSDNAMKGGIDMNTAGLNMFIKRDGNGIVLPMDQQNLEAIKINGLVPVILNITPAINTPMFSELMSTAPAAA